MRIDLKFFYNKFAPIGSKRNLVAQRFITFIRRKFQLRNRNYQKWIERFDQITAHPIKKAAVTAGPFSIGTKFSIIMPVYNPSLILLEEAIQSVRNQTYPNWELCIADDASTSQGVRDLIRKHAIEDKRVHFVMREQNGNISAASNSALELATGDYIVLLDHDDKLHIDALSAAARVVKNHPDAEIVYSDRDKITVKWDRYDPYFKPDFNYELLLCHNFVSHMDIYKLETVRKVGGFRLGLEGSQDYDLLLRVMEQIKPDQVHHIPRVLYHWRASSQSVAENINVKPYAVEAGERALNEHLVRSGVKARVKFNPELTAYQVEYDLQEPYPEIEFVILSSCLEGSCRVVKLLLESTNYKKLRVTLAISDDKFDPAVESLQIDPRVSIVKVDSDLGYNRWLNHWIPLSTANFIGAIDENIISFTIGWVEILLGQAIQQGIGAVGPKLLDARGRVFSNGIVLDQDRMVTHLFRGKSKDYVGYFGWGQLQWGYSAISGKCILFKRENYISVGGLSEGLYTREYSWTDFCLKIRDFGLRNIICPTARVKLGRNKKGGGEYEDLDLDRDYIKNEWSHWLADDPSFNPNLTIKKGNIRINLSSL